METDEDSERSDSEGSEDPAEEDSSEGAAPNRAEEGAEVVPMDTSADGPSHTGTTPSEPTAEAQPNQPTVATIHLEVAGPETDRQLLELATVGVLDHLPELTAAQVQAHPAATDAIAGAGSLRRGLEDRELLPHERALLGLESRTSNRPRIQPRDGPQDDGEDGSDSDESMDEADNPYWASFTPDTSVPDENELSTIEEKEEVDATDHKHWESLAFQPLDDPEYVPQETGRIGWTVTGVHGTPENPNRKTVMRSPSVCIGGLYWNIKYFPRGNEGTDFMSVYVECSNKPHEHSEETNSEIEVIEEKGASGSRNGETSDIAPASDVEIHVQNEAQDHQPPEPMAVGTTLSSKETTPTPSESEEAPWATAAQIACVVYNPQEPRVYAHQQCSHQYYNGNPDWGWTRFHGPWNEIHTRKRFQRKPLLQNDTLEFAVYIRLFQDRTKSLWWHPSDTHPVWDSMSLLGVRGLKCREGPSSAMVAAVSAWMHLGNIVREASNLDIPDQLEGAGALLSPALKEFQEILVKEGLMSESTEVNLSTLVLVLGYFYGVDIGSKRDVVLVWENLRRILNVETDLREPSRPNRDVCNDVVMLKQPDPFKGTDENEAYIVKPRNGELLDASHEPTSVQEALDLTSKHRDRAFKAWEGAGGQEKSRAASVLQIELHRQSYNADERKWHKLTHKIHVDETVQCNQYRYTLYGIIVHRGGLDYSEYYSVLRPGGPGTQWIKYAGDASARSVEILTTKQAIDAHEGGGNDEYSSVAYVAIYVRTDRLIEVLAKDSRKETLRATLKRKSDQMSMSEQGANVEANVPFRVGRRYWRKALPATTKIYESIRETSHLSRTFYRTQYNGDEPVAISAAPVTSTSEVGGVETVDKAEDKAGDKAEDKVQDKGPATHQITVWLRVFDPSYQTLSEAEPSSTNGAANIIQHFREHLGAQDDETWDFYYEQGLAIRSKNLVKRSYTFFDLSYGDTTWDGMVYIAQRHPTKEEYAKLSRDDSLNLCADIHDRISALQKNGKCINPVEYSQYLLGDYHSKILAAHTSDHYFTFPYLYAPLSYGRPHGEGVHISLSGSEYRGPFRCGRKEGPNGTMNYACGDTYVGDWREDEPDGQGTMTYAKTGNVYTGGFRKRRRWGRGTMTYAVADEETMLCQICYEKNMDTAFCFCGHVVSCEECARRLDICPVCREPVKRIIKLKGAIGRTAAEGGSAGSWGGGFEGGGGVGLI